MTTPTQAQIEAAARAIHRCLYDELHYGLPASISIAKAALAAAAGADKQERLEHCFGEFAKPPAAGVGMRDETYWAEATPINWERKCNRIEAETIEACAQVAESFPINGWQRGPEIAAAIRAMKDDK